MIATVGYDGFLYSIGYLAGWIVALFVVAEPIKRLGKYTFTDAVDAKYNSRGIKLAAAISTLVVSICYLIPQMVGAGVLVEPLLGLPHAWGVIMVGAIVITIVATAGMASTTYVQFLKGGLLIVFSTILVGAVCVRGFSTQPDQGGAGALLRVRRSCTATQTDDGLDGHGAGLAGRRGAGAQGRPGLRQAGRRGRRRRGGRPHEAEGVVALDETQSVETADGEQVDQRRAGLRRQPAAPGRQPRAGARRGSRRRPAASSTRSTSWPP